MSERTIIRDYISAHPGAVDGVCRAMFAYNIDHFRQHPGAHHFLTAYHPGNRAQCCEWCGRSRESIRWDEQEKPECAKRPKWADETITSVIAAEEKKFAKVIDRAKKLCITITPQTTGTELAHLHHTHGIDPSMLECALLEQGMPGLTEAQHEEYQAAYAAHQETGARGFKPSVVVAR